MERHSKVKDKNTVKDELRIINRILIAHLRKVFSVLSDTVYENPCI